MKIWKYISEYLLFRWLIRKITNHNKSCNHLSETDYTDNYDTISEDIQGITSPLSPAYNHNKPFLKDNISNVLDSYEYEDHIGQMDDLDMEDDADLMDDLDMLDDLDNMDDLDRMDYFDMLDDIDMSNDLDLMDDLDILDDL